MPRKPLKYMDPFKFFSLWFFASLGSKQDQQKLMRSIFEGHAHLMGDWAYDVLPQFFMEDIPPREFKSLQVGDKESMTIEIHPHHLLYFARASGDYGAPHFDKKYAADTHFKEPIAHGLLVGSFVSSILAHKLPGTGTIYKSQTFNFKKPVYIGDTLTATATVKSLDVESLRITLDIVIVNQNGEVVVDGESVVYPAEKLAKKSK
jgi:acyl dehydratase